MTRIVVYVKLYNLFTLKIGDAANYRILKCQECNIQCPTTKWDFFTKINEMCVHTFRQSDRNGMNGKFVEDSES